MLHTPKHDLVKVFLPSLTLTPSDFIPSSLNFLLITQKLGLFVCKKKGCFELVTKKGFLLPNFVPFYNLILFTKKVIVYTGTFLVLWEMQEMAPYGLIWLIWIRLLIVPVYCGVDMNHVLLIAKIISDDAGFKLFVDDLVIINGDDGGMREQWFYSLILWWLASFACFITKQRDFSISSEQRNDLVGYGNNFWGWLSRTFWNLELRVKEKIWMRWSARTHALWIFVFCPWLLLELVVMWSSCLFMCGYYWHSKHVTWLLVEVHLQSCVLYYSWTRSHGTQDGCAILCCNKMRHLKFTSSLILYHGFNLPRRIPSFFLQWIVKEK